MLLSGEEVEWLAKARRLISPFDHERMGPCSYDLAVGAEYYCYRAEDGDTFQVRQLAKPGAQPPGQPDRCEIPPNACAFLLTEETINMPTNLAGQVALRFSLTKKGIMVSPQAPIDPGYSGKILMMLYNLSDETQVLKRGDAFVTIYFHQLADRSAPYTGPNQGGQSIQKFMKRSMPVRSSMATTEAEVKSSGLRLDARFDEKMAVLEKQVSGRLTLALSVIGLLIGIAALVTALVPIGMQIVSKAQDGITAPTPSPTQSAIPTPGATP